MKIKFLIFAEKEIRADYDEYEYDLVEWHDELDDAIKATKEMIRSDMEFGGTVEYDIYAAIIPDDFDGAAEQIKDRKFICRFTI